MFAAAPISATAPGAASSSALISRSTIPSFTEAELGLAAEFRSACGAPTSGRSASVARIRRSSLLRIARRSTSLPGAISLMVATSSPGVWTERPAMLVMRSPGSIPALAAGESLSTRFTSTPTPASLAIPSPASIFASAGCTPMPRYPRATRPVAMIESATRRTTELGTAKPMPSFPPPRLEMAELMPMTAPSRLASGPPELPGLMAASV